MSPVPKKIERGDSLVSPGMVCYAEKQVKPFWFSSLDQIVQFDTIIFCRTFKNYFGQFVWIEKKKKRKVTIIVAFHFMKRRLKTDTFVFARRPWSTNPSKFISIFQYNLLLCRMLHPQYFLFSGRKEQRQNWLDIAFQFRWCSMLMRQFHHI